MNAPGSPQIERRGATGKPGDTGVHSLVFFGGIVLAVGLVAAGALAIWGPEKEVESKSHLATNPQPADSLPGFAPEVATEAPPPVADIPAEAPSDPPADAPKKGKKKGKGKKR